MNREIPQEIRDGAQNGRDWFDAYCEVGFTEEQAMQLVCRAVVSVQSTWPPEMMEAMQRQTAWLERMLAEED